MATTQEAVQISAIVPTLTVDDLQKSITFYQALGFAIDERWEENGTLLGVMLRAGKTQIGLNQDDWKKGRDRKKGIGVRLSIATSTPGLVDELAMRAKNAGMEGFMVKPFRVKDLEKLIREGWTRREKGIESKRVDVVG